MLGTSLVFLLLQLALSLVVRQNQKQSHCNWAGCRISLNSAVNVLKGCFKESVSSSKKVFDSELL